MQSFHWHCTTYCIRSSREHIDVMTGDKKDLGNKLYDYTHTHTHRERERLPWRKIMRVVA